jgi:hypothetical protein
VPNGTVALVVKLTPTVFDAAPINVKSVVPTVRIVAVVPETNDVAFAIALTVITCPAVMPCAATVLTVTVVVDWLIEEIAAIEDKLEDDKTVSLDKLVVDSVYVPMPTSHSFATGLTIV